jgi:hypothetical protein
MTNLESLRQKGNSLKKNLKNFTGSRSFKRTQMSASTGCIASASGANVSSSVTGHSTVLDQTNAFYETINENQASVQLRSNSLGLSTNELIAFPEIPMCRLIRSGESGDNGSIGAHCLCWMPNSAGNYALVSQRMSTISCSSGSSTEESVHLANQQKQKPSKQQLFDLRGRKKGKREHRKSDPLVSYNQASSNAYNQMMNQSWCSTSNPYACPLTAGSLDKMSRFPPAPSFPLTEPISGLLIAAVKRKIQTELIDLTATPYTDQVCLF